MAKKDRILTVKISTEKAIVALEDRLAQLKKEYEEQQKHEVEFKKKHDAWYKVLKTSARKMLLEALKNDANVEAWAGREAGMISAKIDARAIVTDLPPEPRRPYDHEPMSEHRYKYMTEEIAQAVRILKMTDEKTVPASTFAALSQYL
jgi:hypothetical protein